MLGSTVSEVSLGPLLAHQGFVWPECSMPWADGPREWPDVQMRQSRPSCKVWVTRGWLSVWETDDQTHVAPRREVPVS